MKILESELQKFFSSNGAYYPLYTKSVELYEELRVHADGDFPTKMIEARRPSETLEILEYRKTTYKAITKLPISKVITSFGKIRRSADWNIPFPKGKISTLISEEETLEKYCTENLPGFATIEQWAFGILLSQNLIDANAVVVVIPVETIVPNSFAKPVPILFNSDQVIVFNEREKYCILKSKKKSSYTLGTANQIGDIFYYIDDQEIIVYEQNKDGFQQKFQQINTTGLFPAWKVKGEAYKQYDNMSLNRSRLHAMVPFLDEAACEYSDLKGSKIQHLYPLFWYYQDKACGICTGTGKVPGKDGPTICGTCDGGGKIKFSPFAHIQLSTPELGRGPIPFSAPAGYISRDTAILELQEKSVERNNYKALAAINMQFLDQTPLSISGDAKEVDRGELNNTVYTTAEDLIYSLDKALFFINEWRYSYIIPDKTKRLSMLPKIPVPQNYDLLSENYLMKEVTDAITNKINPLLIAALEQELAAKKFYTRPEIAANLKLFFDLDPLPGYGVEDKMSLMSNKAITQEDFVISSYMPSFIKRAIREDKDFPSKPYDQQWKTLVAFATEKIKANDPALQMIDEQKQAVLDEISNQNDKVVV